MPYVPAREWCRIQAREEALERDLERAAERVKQLESALAGRVRVAVESMRFGFEGVHCLVHIDPPGQRSAYVPQPPGLISWDLEENLEKQAVAFLNRGRPA